MGATMHGREAIPPTLVEDLADSDPEHREGECVERMQCEPLVDLSQELRPLLALILGPLRDLEAGRCGRLCADARQQIELTRRRAERLQGMVQQILDLIASRRRLRKRFEGGDDNGRARLPLALGVRPSAEDLRWLGKVADAVEAGLGDETFSVEVLAVRLSVHRTQLFRRLRELTGLSPVQLIRHQRLKRAASLLAGGGASVSEAACATGFHSFAHFSSTLR